MKKEKGIARVYKLYTSTFIIFNTEGGEGEVKKKEEKKEEKEKLRRRRRSRRRRRG